MRVSAFLSSTVVGLAAVSVAMPLINGRGIVTIGEPKGMAQAPDTPETVPTTSSSISTPTFTSSSAPTSTPTSGSPTAPHEMHMKVADDGQWNQTKYDDSSKFDNGLWHPSGVVSSSAVPSATGIATPLPVTTGSATAAVPSAASTDASSGTQISGGLALTNHHDLPDPQTPNMASPSLGNLFGPKDKKPEKCTFGFCFSG